MTRSVVKRLIFGRLREPSYYFGGRRVRLNCPVCAALLDLNDALIGKLINCPKCAQNFVVPKVAPPLVAAKAQPKTERAGNDYELSASQEEPEAATQPTDPNTLKFCPGCGGPWKKGAQECAKCHYVPSLGAQLKPKFKQQLGLNYYLQKVYIVFVVVVLGIGAYWLYHNGESLWNSVKSAINSIWPK